MKKFIYTLALALIIHCTLNIENCSAQWQPDVRLTNDTVSSYTSNNNAWCVVANGNVVHAVFYNNLDGNYEIYYKRSTDSGVSWGADTRLTNYTASSGYPSIAVSGSVVHVVWMDNRDENFEIYYKRSTDAGVSWGADLRITNNTSFSRSPSVAVSGLVVHVVWQDNRDGNGEIYYKRSADAGVSWGADIRLTNNSAISEYPTVAVSGSFVHIAWVDRRDGNYEIYYNHSTDGGVTWGADIRLTNNSGESSLPSVAVSGSAVHVVWVDDRDGNYEIFYKRSTDGGVSWGTDTRLSNAPAESIYPSIAVSGSVVHVVWRDSRDVYKEIYYKRSTDAGVNWGADTRLTNKTDDSSSPSVAVSGSVVHVVWMDYRNANNEIYYKRNPTGNVGIQSISTEIPSKYSMGQNYPNPFNPTTKIKFSVVSSPHGLGGDLVLLKVYDVMGRDVQTLVNERLQPGTYEASFDASSLNSGVYFYKLIIRHGGSSTNIFTETKKMLLIK